MRRYKLVMGININLRQREKSYSGFPIQDSFEQISNEIPCVDSFALFLPDLSFELQIKNHYCSPNSHQDNVITFTLMCNHNTSLF